ncbi:MAG: acetyl-CoA carboxylase biotin carboxylase subunit [Candidatus Asgardarchaeia archaeon]
MPYKADLITMQVIRYGLEAIADDMGYRVLLKPAAGGGGIGMHVARSAHQLKRVFKLAQDQAFNAFGDASIYIEKFLSHPRHIEFQIVADKHGNVVHLGERECSIQRRHQKLIEESPSPVLSDDERAIMGGYAIKAAKTIGYDNVGTIEFIYQDGEFYFLEVNARIQVEHGITELRTGIDLIKEQIRIAAGEPLGYTQSDISPKGWAIECRINAEDPFSNFLPNPGVIDDYFEPGGFGVRVDSGVRRGSKVPPEYDSLLAKLMVWGNTREEAISRMRRALDEFVITGVKTTIPLYKIIFTERNFIRGNYNTNYLSKYLRGLLNTLYEEEVKRIAAVTAAINVLLGKNISKLNSMSSNGEVKKIKQYVYPQNPYEIFFLTKWGKKKGISLWQRSLDGY